MNKFIGKRTRKTKDKDKDKANLLHTSIHPSKVALQNVRCVFQSVLWDHGGVAEWVAIPFDKGPGLVSLARISSISNSFLFLVNDDWWWSVRVPAWKSFIGCLVAFEDAHVEYGADSHVRR